MEIRIEIHKEPYLSFFTKMKKEYEFRPYREDQIEQIAYRVYLCKDCLENRKCKYCNCNPNDVLVDPYSCNNQAIFPNFKNPIEWEKMKNEKNIIILS